MPLTPGARLGPYEILLPLGAGGMGEVDKARDTRYFRSNRTGVNALYVRAADGSGTETLVYSQPMEVGASMIVSDLSSDGSTILFTNSGAGSSFDIWALALAPSPQATPVLRSAFNEQQGVLSPDRRWMAFVSDETGRQQVYLQSFPNGELRRPVSSRGGAEPQWRSDGRELYFLDADRNLMAVSVSADPDLLVGVPALLFRTQAPVVGNPYRRPYAVSTDGQRFLVNTAPADAPAPAIHVVVDWRALLESGRR